jgi:hypothetical protein
MQIHIPSLNNYVQLNTIFVYIDIYIIVEACSDCLILSQRNIHRQSLEDINLYHNIEILKEELTRIWQSNLQAFQYWGPPETRTIMAEF